MLAASLTSNENFVLRREIAMVPRASDPVCHPASRARTAARRAGTKAAAMPW